MSWLYLLAVKGIFRYSHKSEIEINASQKDVWNILTDCASYPEWNKLTKHVDTDWIVGNEVFLTIKLGSTSKTLLFTEMLKEFVPMEKISWGKKMFHYQIKREQMLVTLSSGKTLYSNRLIVSGLITPIIQLLWGKFLNITYKEMQDSLKEYAEQKASVA